MRTMEEIKALRKKGSRKWGKDLYHHITPMVDSFLSLEEISQKLLNDHDFIITPHRLKNNIHYYKRKLNPPSSATALVSQATTQIPGSIAQKQEAPPPSLLSSSAPRPKRNYDFDEDFRTPTPKPTSVFSTKKAPDQ